MMRTPIATARIGLAVLVGVVLAGCGGQVVGTPSAAGQPTIDPSPAARASGRTGEEATIENMIRRYNEALLARDWATACGLAAPATVDKLMENLRNHGAAVDSCQAAFTAIYAVPDAAKAADGISRTTEVEKVQVSGDRAAVTWSAVYYSQRTSVESAAIRVDGKWQLLDTSD